MEDILSQNKAELQKIGEIFSYLNFIDVNIVAILTIILSDLTATEEKHILINDILFDENIFETFEQKRRLLKKIIERSAAIARKKKIAFDEEKYLELCKDFLKIQQKRNIIAHKYLTYSPGKAHYLSRKNDSELYRRGEPTINLKELDLDEIIKDTKDVSNRIEKELIEFLNFIHTNRLFYD